MSNTPVLYLLLGIVSASWTGDMPVGCLKYKGLFTKFHKFKAVYVRSRAETLLSGDVWAPVFPQLSVNNLKRMDCYSKPGELAGAYW